MIFRPTYVFKAVTDITLDFLKKNHIGGLMLDLDNTLTTHNNPQPAEKISDWLEVMKSAGIRLMIVSNNRAERVMPFAESLKLSFVASGRKPLSSGFNKAQVLMDIPFENIAIVGDQIFTDVLGANLRRVRTIYVHPIELEKGFFFKLKRALEKPFIRKIKITGE